MVIILFEEIVNILKKKVKNKKGMVDCSLENWNIDICRKKRKQWWIFVTFILLLLFLVWILVIFYLLSPHTNNMVNRQLLVSNSEGKNSLVLLQSCEFEKAHSFIKKQDYVKIYDLKTRKWHSQPYLSLVPSFRSKDTFYLLHYCPEKKKFSQAQFYEQDTIVTDCPYNTSSYLFNEFLVYCRIHSSKHHHHLFYPV